MGVSRGHWSFAKRDPLGARVRARLVVFNEAAAGPAGVERLAVYLRDETGAPQVTRVDPRGRCAEDSAGQSAVRILSELSWAQPTRTR